MAFWDTSGLELSDWLVSRPDIRRIPDQCDGWESERLISRIANHVRGEVNFAIPLGRKIHFRLHRKMGRYRTWR